MFVDAAAMVAILGNEPEADRCAAALAVAIRPLTNAIATWEATVALARPDKFGDFELAREAVARLLERLEIELCQFPEPVLLLALSTDAAQRYGRGPRRLNLADCFHYACAKHFAVPMLSTANEFRLTDLETVP